MPRTWTTGDHDQAREFLSSLDDTTQRAVIGLLAASPDQRFDTAAVATALGLHDHKDVARATYAMGRALAARGLARPWTEAQQGYAMPAELAGLFVPESTEPA